MPETALQMPDVAAPRAFACQTLTQLSGGANWRLTLLHDLDTHVLIWMTRGQGRALIDGVRRGVGAHNALFLPAGTLWSLDAGAQGFGQTVLVPRDDRQTWPETPEHLRVRDVQSQTELTGLLEAMQREETAARPFLAEAQSAHGALLSVWLRRQMARRGPAPTLSAGERLVSRYARLVAEEFRSARGVADYAAELGVTATHLTRACRAANGRTAADILTERVIWEARRLLSRETGAVQDIARHLGFSSPAYFTRYIQHHTGATPSVLRRRAIRRA